MKSCVSTLVVLVLAAATGCGDAGPAEEDVGTDAAFVTSNDDEALDPNDPPTDPDPFDAVEEASLAPRAGGANGQQCVPRSKTLSPKGLTLVIHVPKNPANAQKAYDHLSAMRRYIRARDIFMVERGSPVNVKLHELFPCNAFHFIAYPGELDTALQTGDLMDGIAVDWEGGQVDGNSQAFSIDKLEGFAKKIRSKGKQPGFVPAWKPRFVDAQIKRATKMDYELAQIQPACVNSPAAFAHRAKELLSESKRFNEPLRELGFEISLDSYSVAPNHVGADRAAACTRAAYGKGARAIYIYGNGDDKLVPYFKELGKLGLRRAR